MLSQKMSFSLFYNFIKIVAICHCKDVRPLFPSEQNSGLFFHEVSGLFLKEHLH